MQTDGSNINGSKLALCPVYFCPWGKQTPMTPGFQQSTFSIFYFTTETDSNITASAAHCIHVFSLPPRQRKEHSIKIPKVSFLHVLFLPSNRTNSRTSGFQQYSLSQFPPGKHILTKSHVCNRLKVIDQPKAGKKHFHFYTNELSKICQKIKYFKDTTTNSI